MVAQFLLYSAALPLAGTLAAWEAGRRAAQHLGMPAGRWAAAVVFGGMFLASYLLLPWTPAWPEDSWHWLPWLVLLAGGVSCGSSVSGRAWHVWGWRMGLSLLAAWLIVPAWEEMQPWRPGWIAASAGIMLLLLGHFDRCLAVGRGRVLAAVLCASFLAGGYVLLEAATAKFAQLSIAMACALAPAAILAPRHGLHAAVLPAAAIFLPGIVLNSYFYTFSELPLLAFLAVVGLPLTVALFDLPLWKACVDGFAVMGTRKARDGQPASGSR